MFLIIKLLFNIIIIISNNGSNIYRGELYVLAVTVKMSSAQKRENQLS